MRYAFLVLALVLLHGCARETPAPRTRLSFQRFVTVMSELSTAQPHQRGAIMQAHKATEADIREFVVAYATDPRQLSAAFDSIEKAIERKRASTP